MQFTTERRRAETKEAAREPSVADNVGGPNNRNVPGCPKVAASRQVPRKTTQCDQKHILCGVHQWFGRHTQVTECLRYETGALLRDLTRCGTLCIRTTAFGRWSQGINVLRSCVHGEGGKSDWLAFLATNRHSNPSPAKGMIASGRCNSCVTFATSR